MTALTKILALILALLLVGVAFAGCGNGGNTVVDDGQKGQNGGEEEGGENGNGDEKEDDGKLVITDTFYPQYTAASLKQYNEMKAKLRAWIVEKLESAELFSAALADTDTASLRSRMKKDISSVTDENGNEVFTAVYTDEASELEFIGTATLYGDNPTVDYVMRVTNKSQTKRSPRVSSLYVLDAEFPLASSKGYELNTNLGSHADIDDFLPVKMTLSRSEKLTLFSPTGGSSSNDTAFPFFDVIGKDEGLILAVGWSGTWEAGFSNPATGSVRLAVRQKNFDTVLLPGESVRTPSVVLTYFTGDAEYGHNVWRRNVISHYTPSSDNEQGYTAPISYSSWGGHTVSFFKKAIDLMKDAPFDFFWLDAGWYGQAGLPEKEDAIVMGSTGKFIWHQYLGVWSQNKKLFPNGIVEVSDYVHANSNMKMLLWWMIEDARATEMSEWTFDPSNYYLTKDADGKYTYEQALRLDDDAVTDMLIDYFRSYIDDQHIDAVRLDKSASLDGFWAYYDDIYSVEQTGSKGNRNGITEAKYIENFYRLWDTLIEEYPKFMLDNCSSGGRRIDIEMTKRSIPLWRTDYNSGLESTQAMTQYLSKWLPLTGTGSASGNEYHYRSFYSASVSIGQTIHEMDIEAKLKILNEFVEMRPFWYGDYYQLLEPNRDENAWQAYQLYREDWQKGHVIIIRRNSPISTQKIKLKGLIPEATYIIHDFDAEDNSADITKTGAELMDKGLNISLGSTAIANYSLTLDVSSVETAE